MPITEVPTSPPGAPPEPPRFSRPSRYEEYSTHDLLSVIEDLEGSRNWVSLREKLWIAIIVHMIVLWFLIYGPKYIFHQRVRVVDQSALAKRNQMTYLETPDDIKPMKPKPTPFISNKNHVAETPHPTLDKKTLEELEAMRRAGRLVPNPAPAQPSPTPEKAAPQAAQQPKTPAQPLPNNTKSLIQAPTPAQPKPNFNPGRSTPGQELQEMARNAARSGQYGGDEGAGAPSDHPGNQGAVDILSDTMGVDFGPYIQRVIWDTKRAWYPIIPEEAQDPLRKQGRVGIRFKIGRDGTVIPGSMHLDAPSGDISLDRAAWGGITGAGYPPLPKNFKGKYLELRFYFLYNIPLGDQ
ncbi:MAG: energy transducer TonB [Silvibacterium sp.]